MRYLSLLMITVFFFACKKEDTTLNSSGTRLISTMLEVNDQKIPTVYTYEDDKVIEVKNRDWVKTLYYRNDSLFEVYTYSFILSDTTGRDSFGYSNGLLDAVYNFSKYDTLGLVLRTVFEYFYNTSLQVEELKIIGVTNSSITTQQFTWKDNNIIVMSEQYNGKARQDFFYTYDKKKNFKTDMLFRFHPLARSVNNVLSMDYIDYTGSYNINCGPCITTYTYNKSNYPTSIFNEDGSVLNLFYD